VTEETAVLPQAEPPVEAVEAATPAPVVPSELELTEDGNTDPIKRAGAALEARASRKSRRDKGEDAARAEARAQKRAEERARRREQKREAKEQKRLARQQQVEPDQGAEQPEEEQPQKSELTAPAEALVARLPTIKPVYAAIITGALAGLSAVLLTIGAAKGCESVRDTSSCGGGVGLLAVVAILAIEVLIGANLLKAWQISDPFSTSFLGVGVVATIAMLTFLSHIDSPWMLLVIPVSTAAAFAVSWWITVRFVDEHPMASEVDAERGEPAFGAEPTSDVDVTADEDSSA
jgi:hypothetical protein